MYITGWGNTFPIKSKSILNIRKVQDAIAGGTPFIARGLGRSYGDSAVYPIHFDTTVLNRFIAFDKQRGLLTAQAGVSLADIIDLIVPHGWFLAVTPGTKFVTLGGAIASDVHGKNHHKDGCFSEYCTQIAYINADGKTCTITKQDTEFTHVCGGMGLFGVIIWATLQLIPITSPYINQITYKAHNIDHMLDLFECHHNSTYMVAWIDCLSGGKGLVMCGEHDRQNAPLVYLTKKHKRMPWLPHFVLNSVSIKMFNRIYFHKVCGQKKHQTVHMDSFFYPLDSIHNWNRMYGRRGFVQYQCVVPKTATGRQALIDMLQIISSHKQRAFLSVLKTMGEANKNILSFPMHGYTLAMDFKYSKKLHLLTRQLDEIVVTSGGRLYLAKDALMTSEMMQKTYTSYADIKRLHRSIFVSNQSERLGI